MNEVGMTPGIELSGKVALVTGGARNIGRAISRSLAAGGATVMVNANTSQGEAKHTVAMIKSSGGTAAYHFADVTDPAAVAKMVDATVKEFGRLDILVNNAGAIRGGDFLTTADDEWLRGWSLKLLGYIRMAREVLPHMQRQGGGRIVNVVGAAARNPSPTYMMGGTANAALINFTKALADLGAKSNVLVTAVSPGPVKTERWDRLVEQQAAAAGRDVESYTKDQSAAMPLGRIALPEEVADLVCFLASERASFLTGIAITIDGGISRGVYL
jgi:NAD(P)-dependent dehydrogenase (short-subunit alcohol dehydrogenase family)